MSKKGFTLLEVLLAILLTVTGFVALLQAASVALSASGYNEAELVAINLAQDKIEDVRTVSFSSIADEAKAAVPDYPAFSREVVVTTPQSGLKQVSVNVYWFAKSAEMNTSLITYASDI